MAAAKVKRGEIDRDGWYRDLILTPRSHLAASLAQRPVSDSLDLSDLLGKRHEFSRRDISKSAICPAAQRLYPDELHRVELKLRLIFEPQGTSGESIAKSCSKDQAVLCKLIHLGTVEVIK